MSSSAEVDNIIETYYYLYLLAGKQRNDKFEPNTIIFRVSSQCLRVDLFYIFKGTIDFVSELASNLLVGPSESLSNPDVVVRLEKFSTWKLILVQPF